MIVEPFSQRDEGEGVFESKQESTKALSDRETPRDIFHKPILHSKDHKVIEEVDESKLISEAPSVHRLVTDDDDSKLSFKPECAHPEGMGPASAVDSELKLSGVRDSRVEEILEAN